MTKTADDAMTKAFLRIARRLRSSRIEKLLGEIDRLNELEDVELVKSEVLDFYQADREFPQAVRTAKKLWTALDEKVVDYVSFRPARGGVRWVVYVVFQRGHPLVSGHETNVSTDTLVSAWSESSS